MALASLGYLTFLLPALADYLSHYNLTPAASGEESLMLWLLVMGVNAQRWREQASAAGPPNASGWSRKLTATKPDFRLDWLTKN